jgi:hypothetical protein
MNNYYKYAPNVFIARCTEKHEKGDIINVTTKYGKENECTVHNFLGYSGTQENPLFCYSITRTDGFNAQEYVKQKAERIASFANSAQNKSDEYYSKSNKDKDFLSLAEPIKIGHHSEGRHRKIIEQAQNNMSKCVELSKKADSYDARISYWEGRKDVINLSMPESVEYYEFELEQATKYHQDVKDGVIPKDHSYTLTYANKAKKQAQNNYDLAVKLWS